MTKKEVHGTFPRPKKPFEPDPLVKGKSAEHGDYTNSGYSRGHMAPAADMKWSELAMNESFISVTSVLNSQSLTAVYGNVSKKDVEHWLTKELSISVVDR